MDEEEEEEELGQMPGGNLSDNFATYSRLRANTWPLNRFDETNNKTSQDPEDAEGSHPESSPDGTEGSGGGRHNFSGSSTGIFIPSPNPGGTLLNAAEIPSSTSADTSTSPVGSGTNQTSPAKKNSSRRNAWGNLSYADLITQAITSTPEQRLTLSQIYDWIVQNVAFFKDKGDNNSSAGWKNSVRHNLSLHNRFMRVQNEGTGKSSWWMINPDAKPGKSTRRRAASMETQKYEKRRGRVKKQLEEQRRLGGESGLGLGLTLRNPSSPISESTECLFPLAGSHSNLAIIGNDSSAPKQLSPMHTLHAGLVEGFRSRSGSNASSFGRLSPFEEQHTPSYSPQQWMAEYEYNNSGTLRNSQIKSESKAELAELDSLAHSMRLNDSAYGLDGHNLKTSTDLRTQSPRIISAQTPPFYPPWIQTQKSCGKDGAVNATGGKVDLSSLCNPTSNSGYSLSSIHTSIFSGGTSTFTSIPDESDRPPTHTTPTRNVSAPNLPQFLPSIHIRPSLSTRFPVPPQTSSQSRSENTGPGQNDNLFNGQFPADLEMIPMDTTGPSTFEGFNDEILNEVLKQELREEGNLNFDDLEELGECFRGNGNGFVNGGLGGGVSSMPHSSSGTIGLSFTTPKSTVRPTYVRQP